MKKVTKLRYMILGAVITMILSNTLIPVIAEKTTKQLSATYNNIKIVIDGETVTLKDSTGQVIEPFIVEGTTYLPVRAISEAVGKDVEWNGTTNTVYLNSPSEANGGPGQKNK